MPILSLANLMMTEVDALTQIDAAASAGYDAVGLCIHPSDRLQSSLVTDASLRRTVKKSLADTGLTVLDIEVFPLRPDVEIAAFGPALEAGADLGATFVLVTGNDTDEARVCDHFAELCELAAPLKLKPTLEFISYRPLATIGQAVRWLERARHPKEGLCVDALHLFRSGGTLADLRAVDPTAIGYAQICDAASLAPSSAFTEAELLRESRTDRRLPGEGVLPLVAFLKTLPAGLAISVEAPCEAYANRSPAERARLALRTSRDVIDEAGYA